MASLRRIRMLANAVRNIMNDSERKPLYTIFVEIIRLWFRDRTPTCPLLHISSLPPGFQQ